MKCTSGDEQPLRMNPEIRASGVLGTDERGNGRRYKRAPAVVFLFVYYVLYIHTLM